MEDGDYWGLCETTVGVEVGSDFVPKGLNRGKILFINDILENLSAMDVLYFVTLALSAGAFAEKVFLPFMPLRSITFSISGCAKSVTFEIPRLYILFQLICSLVTLSFPPQVEQLLMSKVGFLLYLPLMSIQLYIMPLPFYSSPQHISSCTNHVLFIVTNSPFP